MKTFPCPSCGAEVVFRTSVAAYAVCPYCQTMLVRTDDGIKAIGTMAQLPEDMSPFQVGSSGIYKNVHFTIVGRMKIGWSDGNWNEWFFVSDDARKGWLAEAQGFYAPCFDVTEDLNDDDKSALKDLAKRLGVDSQLAVHYDSLLGEYVQLGQTHFKIVDIKDATCIGAEGELPFNAPKGRETISVDLLREGGEFGSIEFGPEGPRVFRGRYLSWQELGCSNFRTFEGW